MARLPDPVPSLTGEDRATYERMLARRQAHGVGLYGPYVALLHDPPLAERIEQLGGFLKFQGTLPRDVYQVAVLCFARRVGAEFEWRDHVQHALDAGVPTAVVDALAASSADVAPQGLPAPYDLVDAVITDALAYRDIDASTQEAAIAALGERGLVELVALVGVYSLIGMVNACFDVPVGEAGR